MSWRVATPVARVISAAWAKHWPPSACGETAAAMPLRSGLRLRQEWLISGAAAPGRHEEPKALRNYSEPDTIRSEGWSAAEGPGGCAAGRLTSRSEARRHAMTFFACAINAAAKIGPVMYGRWDSIQRGR